MRSSEQELTIDTRMLLHATFQISSSEVIQWLIAGLLPLWQVFTRILLAGLLAIGDGIARAARQHHRAAHL
jgi:hypothetical protein